MLRDFDPAHTRHKYCGACPCRAIATSAFGGLNARDIAGEPDAVLKVSPRVPGGSHGNYLVA